jgi:hypothetical protein
MKKKFSALLYLGIFYLTSCISQENPPEIKTPDQSNYSTETIVELTFLGVWTLSVKTSF